MRNPNPLPHRRRVAWRKPKPALDSVADRGPSLLDAIAHGLRINAAIVLRADLEVNCGTPTRYDGLFLTSADCVWQCDYEGSRVLCALDVEAHRTILEWILDGPGASAPTAVERTIVSECIERLLATSPAVPWRECTSDGLKDAVWSTTLELAGKGQRAVIRLFTAAQPEALVFHQPIIDDVPLDVSGQMRLHPARLAVLTQWKPGSILRLNDTTSGVRVQLRIGCGPVVVGSLGSVDGKRAIRLNGSAALAGTL